jgi:uncharacterized protein
MQRCTAFHYDPIPSLTFAATTLNFNNMDIQHIDDGHKGMFFIRQEGHRVAEMTYVWAGQDRIIIDHTAVGDVLKGQGAGKELVAKAVLFAREKGIRILPLCPFAKHVIDTVPEYADVL